MIVTITVVSRCLDIGITFPSLRTHIISLDPPKPGTHTRQELLLFFYRGGSRVPGTEMIWSRLHSWNITELKLKHKTPDSIFQVGKRKRQTRQPGLPALSEGLAGCSSKERQYRAICAVPVTSGSLSGLSPLDQEEEERKDGVRVQQRSAEGNERKSNGLGIHGLFFFN